MVGAGFRVLKVASTNLKPRPISKRRRENTHRAPPEGVGSQGVGPQGVCGEYLVWARRVWAQGPAGAGPRATPEQKGGGKILTVTPLPSKSLLELSRDPST